MSKKSLLLFVICLTAFISACQPNPTPIDSTYQPRDNRAVTNHTETNHSTMNGNSMNHEMTDSNSMNSNRTNSEISNQNSANHSETKPEGRTNSGQ